MPTPILKTPPALTQQTLYWADEDDCRRWADSLAAQPATRQACIELCGDLGAGKTTLARHLLRALGVTGRIKSPSYAVVEPHIAPGLQAWHFDFYRLTDPREWEDAGFRDLFASTGLKLIEWPQHAGDLLPLPDLRIRITPLDETRREVYIQALTPRGADLLAPTNQTDPR